jgi:hypothetical protein
MMEISFLLAAAKENKAMLIKSRVEPESGTLTAGPSTKPVEAILILS